MERLMTSVNYDFYTNNNLTPVINVSGTMTGLGASMALAEVSEAMAQITPRFVNMHELQKNASQVICNLTGADSGFVTASASAGVTLSIAGCMTGLDLGAVEALPTTTGSKNEVIVQMGHLCNYGAAIDQAIRLSGAQIKMIGQSTQVMDHQLEAAFSENTAAALYVVSHHVVEFGQIPLPEFVEICHKRNIPVIVDAASEYDLRGFLDAGADLVIYSAHKFLSGPTAGIVAGRKDLVHAGYLQNLGIGRGMKVGKESIFGAMAALNVWDKRDHEAVRQKELRALELWKAACPDHSGIRSELKPDPTGNPINRLRITIDAQLTGFSALALSKEFAAHSPAIVVRDHEAFDLEFIALDPCNLAAGQTEVVAEAIKCILEKALQTGLPDPDVTIWRNASATGYLNWNPSD
jgi:uncharacterized pyridoxal phosphate-dependent enzyme